MVIFSFLIIFVFLLSSCMSEIKDLEGESGLHPIPEICCLQTEMSKLATADSTKTTRGWEGSVGSQDQFPTINYPLNTIYLMVYNGGWQSLPIPIQTSTSQVNGQTQITKYFEICYRADADAEHNIYAMSGGKSIQIGPDMKCFFSSLPTISTGVEKSPTIKTPGGTSVYEPFGDRLFRSDDIYFYFEESAEDDNGDLYENKIFSTWNGEGNYSPIDQLKRIPMARGTSVIIPRLIICNDFPQWSEGQPITNKTYTLTKDDFEKQLGPLENWKVRFFLAGATNTNNYPTKLDLDNFSYNTNLGELTIGKPKRGPKGILALSKDELPIDSIAHNITSNTSDEKTTYIGVGVHDASLPFVYEVLPEQFQKMNICCTLYYTDPDNANNNKAYTIRFPINDPNISMNKIHTISYIVDIDDIKKQFFPTSPLKETKGVQSQYDENFGEIINIPAVIVEDQPKSIDEIIVHE